MADHKDWSSSSNDVLQITLKDQRIDTSRDISFSPSFTYPIYGEEETIFGYQSLRINLEFTADTLQPSLNITSKAKFQAQGEVKPDDVEKPLREVIPGLNSHGPSSDAEAKDSTAWHPPGELLQEYKVDGQRYGTWTTTLSDRKAKEVFRNMQAFVLFFIEGGSLIELDDPDWTIDRWRIFFVYAINPTPTPTYSLVGYSTAYTLWHFDHRLKNDPSSSTSHALPEHISEDDTTLQRQIPSRSRISQFLILPPYQRGGHGSRLYEAVYQYFLANPQTIEIPIEDPNESFDDMRDICDLIRLRSNPAFTALRLNTAASLLPKTKSSKLPSATLLDQSKIAPIRTSSKIAPRQFSRLVEMQLLSRIPPLSRNPARLTRKDRASDENDRAYFYWRLLVKQRLYKHNKDSLIQLDLEERVEKLEETLVGVERDYLRLLEAVERRVRKREREKVEDLEDGGDVPVRQAVNGSEEGRKKVNGGGRGVKRRVVDDDEDDEDEDLPVVRESAPKKAKVGA